MTYTLRQRLRNYVMPDTDPFMGLPYSRTWTFLTDAYIAYDNRRWGGTKEDRGTLDPLVIMARLWVIIAEWAWSTHARAYSPRHPQTPAHVSPQELCVHCGSTDSTDLIIDNTCADCHSTNSD